MCSQRTIRNIRCHKFITFRSPLILHINIGLDVLFRYTAPVSDALRTNRQTEYLVRWVAHGSEHDLWMALKQLVHCQDLIEEFEDCQKEAMMTSIASNEQCPMRNSSAFAEASNARRNEIRIAKQSWSFRSLRYQGVQSSSYEIDFNSADTGSESDIAEHDHRSRSPPFEFEHLYFVSLWSLFYLLQRVCGRR